MGSEAPLAEITICGRSCENDRLVVAPMPEDLRAGDLVTFGVTGAYTFSMASNYNRFPRPAVVFAGGGRHWPFFLKIDSMSRVIFWKTPQDEMNK